MTIVYVPEFKAPFGPQGLQVVKWPDVDMVDDAAMNDDDHLVPMMQGCHIWLGVHFKSGTYDAAITSPLHKFKDYFNSTPGSPVFMSGATGSGEISVAAASASVVATGYGAAVNLLAKTHVRPAITTPNTVPLVCDIWIAFVPLQPFGPSGTPA